MQNQVEVLPVLIDDAFKETNCYIIYTTQYVVGVFMCTSPRFSQLEICGDHLSGVIGSLEQIVPNTA